MNIMELQMIAKNHTLLHQHPERLLRIHAFASMSKGPCAELGVCMGGTSKIIAKSTKFKVNIFDTFDGLPEVDNTIDGLLHHDFRANLEQVKRFLSDCNNINIFPGLFPGSAPDDIKDERYGFVHLDGDLYTSTLDGLKYFYPKMLNCGVIMTDDWDYELCKGVNKAFEDFGIPFTNIGSGQCIITK